MSGMRTIHISPSDTGGSQQVPSSLWVEKVADWIAESSRPEAADIARDLHSIARRLAPGSTALGVPPSPSWLAALADWVSLDPRPQAPDFTRQIRRWGAEDVIWLED